MRATIDGVPTLTVDRSDFPRPPHRGVHIATPEDMEFFERFLKALGDEGLGSEDLVYSGFDGAPIRQQGTDPEDTRRHNIWVMDQKFWRWALGTTATATAIDYAERNEVPCIGVYDMEQLRVSEEDEPDVALAEMRDADSTGIFHRVTHRDYPDSFPSAALRGYVFFEYGPES